MATWAIGDVQGCYASLRQLLQKVRFDARHDRLVLLGDLVGRGPAALQVLRFAQRSPCVSAVLGNHDLFLLACAHGLCAAKPQDKLDAVLAAPDRDRLLAWLGAQPLLRLEHDTLLVHAGLLPHWSVQDAMQYAKALSAQLRGPNQRTLLDAYFATRGPAPTPHDTRAEQLNALQVLTLVRTLDGAGQWTPEYSGPLDKIPKGLTPWFLWPGRQSAQVPIAFGHWSAVGGYNDGRVHALDGGCVWGRSLCAMRLEDGARASVGAAEKEKLPTF